MKGGGLLLTFGLQHSSLQSGAQCLQDCGSRQPLPSLTESEFKSSYNCFGRSADIKKGITSTGGRDLECIRPMFRFKCFVCLRLGVSTGLLLYEVAYTSSNGIDTSGRELATPPSLGNAGMYTEDGTGIAIEPGMSNVVLVDGRERRIGAAVSGATVTGVAVLGVAVSGVVVLGIQQVSEQCGEHSYKNRRENYIRTSK